MSSNKELFMVSHVTLFWILAILGATLILFFTAWIEKFNNTRARPRLVMNILRDISRKEEIFFSDLYDMITQDDGMSLTTEEFFQIMNGLMSAHVVCQRVEREDEYITWKGLSLIPCWYGITKSGYEAMRNYDTKEGKKKFESISFSF